jgi:uncharacterized damage-inducible protein DinB
MNQEAFAKTIDELLFETFEGSPHEWSWYVDHATRSGLFPTLDALDAAAASSRPHAGGSSIAAHARHLLISLQGTIKAARGENPQTDWPATWSVQELDQAAWNKLREELKAAWAETREAARATPLDQAEAVTGLLATLAHTAYHLGAIRQLALATRAAPSDVD